MPHYSRRHSRSHLLRRVAAVALMVAAIGLTGAVVGACSTPATTASVTGASQQPSATALGSGTAKPVDDWTHCLQVFASLKAAPPSDPVVLLLGGSAARECSISDSVWTDQVKQAGVSAATIYDLGSRNRTTAQDLALIKALPKNSLHGIVFIGVNVGRFTSPAKTAAKISLPTTIKSSADLSPYQQHSYSKSRILSAAAKRLALKKWLVMRYPIFKQNYSTSAKMLETLITTCQSRGLHAVLIELPRNMAIIGHQLDTPIARYRATCVKLSKKHHVPFVSFVAAAKLKNGDFYDLWHLVEPGRVKWQSILSARTASLMKKYGLAGAAN
jgi:hypothetical protein